MLNTKSFFYKIHGMKRKMFYRLAQLFFLTFMLASCSTTSKAQKSFEKAEPYSDNYITEENRNLSFTPEQFSSDKFLFIRFHHINYGKGGKILYVWRTIASFMGKGTNGNTYTHTAISCYLDDDFIGITTQGENQVKHEEFSKPHKIPYFRKIDMEKTSCTVMAFPVSESDWENCRKLLQWAVDPQRDFKFSKTSALAIPFKHKKARKLLKTWDYKKNSDYTSVSLPSDYEECFRENKSFACSGFIMQVLFSATAKYRELHEKTGIDATAFSPSELFYLDQGQLLFSSRASYYDKAVADYLKIYPEFSRYYNGPRD